MEQTYHKYIRFNPWIGSHYEDGLIDGIKVLVLGESHYCDDVPEGQKQRHNCPKESCHYCDLCYMDIECHLKTQDTIREFLRGIAYRAQRVFGRRVNGRCLSREEEVDLWNRIAFYEYIQYSQTGPRVSLNQGDPRVNKEAFLELLDYLKPDRIIVWGKRFYNSFGQEVHNHPNFARAFTMTIRNTPVLIMDHPSSSYCSWKWKDVLKPFIKSGK